MLPVVMRHGETKLELPGQQSIGTKQTVNVAGRGMNYTQSRLVTPIDDIASYLVTALYSLVQPRAPGLSVGGIHESATHAFNGVTTSPERRRYFAKDVRIEHDFMTF